MKNCPRGARLPKLDAGVPLFMKIHHLKRCPLSKLFIFYQNFMKLDHIKYHDVFKFDNGPYRNMLSVVMALCL